MLYQHKRTGDLYRFLLESFSTERQTPTAVYMQISTGAIFDREMKFFMENFNPYGDPQHEIVPKDKNQTELKV